MNPLPVTQSKKPSNFQLILPQALNPPPILSKAPPIPDYIDGRDPLATGIYYHENSLYDLSAYYFSIAASKGDPTGLFLFAISMRHGWGMKPDQVQAFKLLSQCTDMYEEAVSKQMNMATHLPLALYEVGMSHQQGWGTEQNKGEAAYYFKLAANLGDADAQIALGECFLRGDGVKPSKKEAARWFRMAEDQGARMVQMQWIVFFINQAETQIHA